MLSRDSRALNHTSMPSSTKRRLEEVQNEEDSSGAVVSGNEKHQRKRIRVHDINAGNNSASESESTDMSLHDEDEDNGAEIHTVRPARLSIGGSSGIMPDISETGTIGAMELVNFMCHKYLKMDFGSKINFVIGHNGSGKSAILTGLTVALGAKAMVTNRASNLGDLVKAGANVGQVTVKIINKGIDAYKPDVYGEFIMVERRISKNGSSGYKIKTAGGKTISTKREELIAICDHMSIQVDNPLTFLSQDSARQFLSSSTPEDKYKFFLKGTQLTQLTQDYEQIRESVDSTMVVINKNKNGLEDLYKKAKEAELRYREILEAQELDEQIDQLSNELVWLQIITKEKQVRKAQLDESKANETLQATIARHQRQQEESGQLQQETQSIQRELAELRKQTEPYAVEKRKLVETIKQKDKDIQAIMDQGREINNQVKSLRSQIAAYDKQIKEEASKLESENRSRREQTTQNIERLQAQLDDTRNEFAAMEKKILSIANQEEEDKRRKEEMELELRRTERELGDLEKSIRDMQSQKENRLRAFGYGMPELVEDIAREKRWRGRAPVGPFGRYIKLERPEFANVLETTVGRMLNNFVVETFEDKRLLAQLLDRRKMNNCQIFVAKYDLFDYSSGEPDPKFLTILKALKPRKFAFLQFENEWVKRQMIISGSIEKIILMSDRAEADRVMYNNGQPLKNVKSCFTSQGHRVGANSGMRTESLPMYRGSPRLSTDIDEKLREHQQRLDNAKRSIELKRTDIRELTTALTKYRNESRELEGGKKKLGTEIRQLRNKLSEMEDKMREDEPVNIAAIEEEKKELEDRIEMYKRQFVDMRAQQLRAKDAKAPFGEKLKIVTDNIAETENKISELRQKLVDKTNDYDVMVRNVSALQAKVENERIRVEGLKRQAEEQETICKQWIQAAMVDYPDRVETNKSQEQLEKEIKYLETRKTEQENNCGASLEEVQEEAKKALKAWDDARKSVDELELFVKTMTKALHDRMEKWQRFLMYISLRAKSYFIYYMHRRGDSGKLNFNHRKQRLEVQVSTGDQFQKGTRHKDSKSLSGGEKSFSQISLLLSLWQGIGSPIFCLDEFDVYMDAVNRKQSMRMMIEAARENAAQYILITPQDASSIAIGSDVTIHRLADPERSDIQ
ncbi:hypothetical protein NQZ79_g6440 [Umbelopsis isabellina]|nr:hypothetical protein NQZ79_g6440 [Umbelopsis isabellina]